MPGKGDASVSALNNAPSLARALNSNNFLPGRFIREKMPIKLSIDEGAILGAIQDSSELAKENARGELGKMLEWIWAGLEEGLSNAWETYEGVGDLADLGDVRKDAIKQKDIQDVMDKLRKEESQKYHTEVARLRNDPEEQWARVITEMFLCVCYGGTGGSYLEFSKKDAETAKKNLTIFHAFVERDVYPLIVACQHASEIGVLSRGFGLEDKVNGVLNAGADIQPGMTNLLPEKGTSIEAGNVGRLLKVEQAIKEGIGPGGVFVYNGEQGANSGAAHIAFVLRVHKDKRMLQFFDTGGMNTGTFADLHANGRPLLFRSIPPQQSDEGVPDSFHWADYQWGAMVKGSFKGVFVGVGICPVQSAEDLSVAVAKLRKKRPLGFARLVISQKEASDDEPLKLSNILYASPLLLMYTEEEEMNFSVARYLWSLRGIGGGKIRAWWYIDTPFKLLAEAMLSSNRKDSMGDLLKSYLERVDKDKAAEAKKQIEDGVLIQSKEIKRVIDLGTIAEGKVRVFKRFHNLHQSVNTPDKAVSQLPWNKPSGLIEMRVADFDEFPYFKGSWDGQSWNKLNK
jgi:hypothetical protein